MPIDLRTLGRRMAIVALIAGLTFFVIWLFVEIAEQLAQLLIGFLMLIMLAVFGAP